MAAADHRDGEVIKAIKRRAEPVHNEASQNVRYWHKADITQRLA
jgi:hypothetical protein